MTSRKSKGDRNLPTSKAREALYAHMKEVHSGLNYVDAHSYSKRFKRCSIFQNNNISYSLANKVSTTSK